MSNIYYNPEEWDLIPFAELELTEPDYSFDILMVWKHIKTGVLYWESDSGCSCPSPFEDVRTIDELYTLETELDYRYFEDVAKTADDRAAMSAFLHKVRRAMPRG